MISAKPLQLPPQLEWKYRDEPALAEWSLKARPYNTDVANGLCVIFFLITVPIAIWAGFDRERALIWQLTLTGFGIALFSSMILSMTHQRTNFAYRLTASGLEFCEWKTFPEWIPQLLKWLAIITGVGMLALAAVHPMAVIGAIVGPGLLGLVYLKMATSKEFRAMHETYHHVIHPWSDFTKITVFRRRSIIGFDFTWYNPDAEISPDKMINSIREIYCKKAGFDELIELIKAQLPDDTPYTEAYIPIYA